MSCLLPTECLNEIFENLADDKITLHSCLLVSRLWCKISVRILWRDILSFKFYASHNCQLEVASAIFSALVSCLPIESKELLRKNEIFISTPTLKSPLFNYAAFCEVLSVNDISRIIHEALIKSDTYIYSPNLEGLNCLILKEMLKMFMIQISSLKLLTCYSPYHNMKILDNNHIPFTSFPGARDRLTDLSKLHCRSDINYQLSQICHNLQSLTIDFKGEVSNELKKLVSSQNNLKNLKLSAYYVVMNSWADIIPDLMKHSNTLTKLHLTYSGDINQLAPLSFISSFLNLQEIDFSFNQTQFEDFKKLQYVTFPKLQTLKFPCQCPKPEYLMKFLEINGKNLKEFYIGNNVSNLSIDKFCPNLKKLYVLLDNNNLDILKTIFNSCHYLEGIVIWCRIRNLNEKKILETVAKYSPKNFYELKLHRPELYPEDLESFFISWKNRPSKKSISLIVVGNDRLKIRKKSMKIIEKFKNLGVIKKFVTRKFCEEEMYL